MQPKLMTTTSLHALNGMLMEFVWTNGREWVVFKKAAMERSDDKKEKEKISELFARDELIDDECKYYFEYFEFLKDNEGAWDEQFEKLSRELVSIWSNS